MVSETLEIEGALPPDMKQLELDLSQQMTHFGVDMSSSAPPSEDTMETLWSISTRLSEALPQFTSGFWATYLAKVEESYNPFLTGYNENVNGAAKSVIDYTEAQCAYGNDMFNAASNFVSTIQQYLINGAQAEANQNTQAAMNETYAVANNASNYNMGQVGILGVQVNTLSTQIQVTMEQVCTGYAYQTTRLYQVCIPADGEPNLLDDLCGRFQTGKNMFIPFSGVMPCKDDATLLAQLKAYMTLLTTMYDDGARTLFNYVTNVGWGGQTTVAADDVPYVNLTIKLWDPEDCPEVDWVNVTTALFCNSSLPENPPTIVYYSCPDGRTPPAKGLTCCNVTVPQEPAGSSCNLKPPVEQGVVYVRSDDLASFANTSTEEWGRLQFTVSPANYKIELAQYDELFVRGTAVYLEGAGIDPVTSGGLWVYITPTGDMKTRVRNTTLESASDCGAYKRVDPRNMCEYDNYTFVGAPETSQVVTYASNYYNVNSDGNCPTSSATKQPVFDVTHEVPGKIYYCSSLNYESLEPGGSGALDQYTNNPPFNFGSLFTEFELIVTNVQGYEDGAGGLIPVVYRSEGIDLSKVKEIKLGLWLRTNGVNNPPVGCPKRCLVDNTC